MTVPTTLPLTEAAMGTLARQIAALLRTADVPPDELVSLGVALECVTATDTPAAYARWVLTDLARLLRPGTAPTQGQVA